VRKIAELRSLNGYSEILTFYKRQKRLECQEKDQFQPCKTGESDAATQGSNRNNSAERAPFDDTTALQCKIKRRGKSLKGR
jgi:hypothetical protein